MSDNDAAIEAAKAELKRCDRAMLMIDKKRIKAHEKYLRVCELWNAILDDQLAARQALAAAISNEQQR